MEHKFSNVPSVNIRRSTFNRSHGLKTTFDAGNLVPIFWDEALPGDTHILDLTAFARLSTPIKPVMDNMFMEFFFFSVPNRLVWDNWQKFCGEQVDPGDSIDYTIPTISWTNGGGATEMTLPDYLGLPIKTTNNVTVSALYTRAYNLIWNEWFRDQNLQDSVTVDTGDGPDTTSNYSILKRGKRHDYFTSALPWPQKGDAVDLPLGTSADILRESNAPAVHLYTAGSDSTAPTNTLSAIASGGDVALAQASTELSMDPNGGLYADLSTATAATINSLRQAFQIQTLLERDARAGTRYVEIIKGHFGVTSPDFRLQRPEYLGGGSIPININPVAQTSESNTTNQGNLAGFGTVSGKGVGFTASFTEHSIILGLVSVRADLTYQQGIERQYLRSTRYDYYWPSLARIGEQVVENQEIYFDDATPANNESAFGYQERYAEYRYKPSKITGLFRSDATGTLDIWHLSEDFSSLPALNDSFIQDDPPIDRIIATPTEPHFIYDSYINLRSVRPMPIYGVPFDLGRF